MAVLKLKGYSFLWCETLKKRWVRELILKSRLDKSSRNTWKKDSYLLYTSKNSTSTSPILAKRILRWKNMSGEQLLMRVGMNKDIKLNLTRFIKGLSSSIANKVELQPYLSFNDLYHLAIKIEKQLKGRRPFPTPSPHRR